jgi:hypothetical protein
VLLSFFITWCWMLRVGDGISWRGRLGTLLDLRRRLMRNSAGVDTETTSFSLLPLRNKGKLALTMKRVRRLGTFRLMTTTKSCMMGAYSR